MTTSMAFLGRALGLLALACAAAESDEPRRDAKQKPVRVYTNADLDRVHPFAAETGGSSIPAVASEPEAAKPERRGRGEPYWRDEAARVRERVRALEERAASLRTRIAERSRETPVYGRRGNAASSRSNGLASLQAALAALERRIQSTQYDLEERARRDGALPGWLR